MHFIANKMKISQNSKKYMRNWNQQKWCGRRSQKHSQIAFRHPGIKGFVRFSHCDANSRRSTEVAFRNLYVWHDKRPIDHFNLQIRYINFTMIEKPFDHNRWEILWSFLSEHEDPELQRNDINLHVWVGWWVTCPCERLRQLLHLTLRRGHYDHLPTRVPHFSILSLWKNKKFPNLDNHRNMRWRG